VFREAGMRAHVIVVGTIGLAAVLFGCGGSDGGGSDTARVDVGLKEFTVTPDPVDVHTGKTEFTADNIGSEVHEMVIVRAKTAGDLPTEDDGSVDEDRIPKADKVGEIEDVPVGKTKSTTFDMKAGDYVIFCNVVEDESDGTKTSHFNEGMHESFSVG
jgi:hypothetical protein